MRNRVSIDDHGVQVEPKVMEVLVCLARHSGRTVTKDMFFQEVWQDTIVSEDVLSRCISELRRVLHDDAREPRFIETIRKTGYRLIADVEIYRPGEAPRDGASSGSALRSADALSPSSGSARQGKALTWIAVAMVVLGSISLAATIIYRTIAGNSTIQHFHGPLQTVPYTSYRGLEVDPVLSPSGDQVAFAWDDDFTANYDIYLKQTGAESPLRLTDSEFSDRFPTWSPDGLRLAFVRSSDVGDAIFTIPSIGGKERKYADFGRRRIYGLSWSPEGDLMAVSAQAEVGGSAAIYLARLDSAGLRQLTNPPNTHLGDILPRFSPDAGWVAFIRSLSHDVQDVYIASVKTGDIRAATADSVAVTGLDWTPNGREIVFASLRGYMSSLFRVPLRGGDPEWIVSASIGNVLEYPSLARTGNRLTYVRHSSNTNIWKLELGGLNGDVAVPVIFTTGWDSYAAIAPNGQRIAYVSDQTGQRDIWVSDLDGRSPVRLTSSRGSPLTPSWSSDGSTLAYAFRRMGQADIFVIDSEGGNELRVTNSPAEDLYPHWSPDSKWIVFASNRTGEWEVWRTLADGSKVEQVTRDGGLIGVPDWTGRYLYIVRPGIDGIWRQRWIDESEEPESVVSDLATRDFANWSVSRGGIYYVRRNERSVELAYKDFASGRTRSIHEPARLPYGPLISADRDGTTLVYTQLDEDAADIQMVNIFN